MAILDNFFMEFGGEPVVNKLPARIITTDGSVVSPEDFGLLQSAYMEFSTANRLSVAPAAVKTMDVGGMTVRMESGYNMDTIWVRRKFNFDTDGDGLLSKDEELVKSDFLLASFECYVVDIPHVYSMPIFNIGIRPGWTRGAVPGLAGAEYNWSQTTFRLYPDEKAYLHLALIPAMSLEPFPGLYYEANPHSCAQIKITPYFAPVEIQVADDLGNAWPTPAYTAALRSARSHADLLALGLVTKDGLTAPSGHEWVYLREAFDSDYLQGVRPTPFASFSQPDRVPYEETYKFAFYDSAAVLFDERSKLVEAGTEIRMAIQVSNPGIYDEFDRGYFEPPMYKLSAPYCYIESWR